MACLMAHLLVALWELNASMRVGGVSCGRKGWVLAVSAEVTGLQ